MGFKKIGLSVLLLAIFVVGLCGCSILSNDVAKVGDLSVTKKEFGYFLGQVKSEMISANKPGATADDTKKYWNDKTDGKENRQIAIDKALDLAREYEIRLNEAKKQKVGLTKEEEDNFSSTLNQKVQDSGGIEATEAQVKQVYGLAFSELKEILYNFQLINKFMNNKMKEFPVSEQEKKDFYAKPENKELVDKAKVVHVLRLTMDMTSGQEKSKELQEEAKKKAEDILKRVQDGEDITKLALEYSEDSGITQNKGEYTFSIKDNLMDEFKQWAFKAKVGESGIVKTSYGYHVMKLQKRMFYEDKEVQDEIVSRIQFDKGKEQIEKWMKEPSYQVKKIDSVMNGIKKDI